MVLNVTDANFVKSLSANYTQAQLTTFLKERLSACGFLSPIESLGTTDKVGYELTLSTATFGRVKFILEVSVAGTNATVSAKLYASQNFNFTGFIPVTNTGANGVTGASFTINMANPLIVYSLPITNQIMGLVFVESGTTFKGILGVSYPTKEAWYDENVWCWGQLIQPIAPNSTWLAYPNPSGNSGTTAQISRAKIDTFATRNPVNNLAQILPAPYLTTMTWGISGKYNSDIGISNNSGFLTNDISIKQAGIEEYWNLFCGDCGLVLRSV